MITCTQIENVTVISKPGKGFRLYVYREKITRNRKKIPKYGKELFEYANKLIINNKLKGENNGNV